MRDTGNVCGRSHGWSTEVAVMKNLSNAHGVRTTQDISRGVCRPISAVWACLKDLEKQGLVSLLTQEMSGLPYKGWVLTSKMSKISEILDGAYDE